MEKEYTVTIPLAEYNDLYAYKVWKDENKSTTYILFDLLKTYGKVKAGYSFEPFVKGIGINNLEAFVNEVLEVLYYADTSRYKEIHELLEDLLAREESCEKE